MTARPSPAALTLLAAVLLALGGAPRAGAQERAAAATEPGAPWPTMRHDRRNTGASPIRARFGGDRPWRHHTGKGIFSTPVIGRDGTAYVGSADTTFAALGPAGRPRWTLRTGGIIDAAAALGPGTVTIGSGDELLYRLRTAPRGLSGRQRLLWRHRPSRRPATAQGVSWWEGNVALGPDGDVYAGNTGGAAYRLSPQGRERWAHQTANSVWTTPAFAADGTTFWGSLDLTAFALDPAGRKRWSTGTLGFVVSSPALSRDERTIYVASFDGRLYALDAATGAVRWTFSTREHVYASPALEEDAEGRVRTVYIASADGSVYAVDPEGRQRWRYDTGDVVRSSPVLGRAPRGDGRIVYVGSGDGRLYALDAATGRRRWSYDTTPADPALRDRNDLNGSPALGRTGVYIGGEHGDLTYIPYDLCLHRRVARCSTAPGEPFGADLTRMLGVTPGGATRAAASLGSRSTATSLAARLVVRRAGQTQDANLLPDQGPERLVSVDPPIGFTAQLSGDGHALHVVPDGFLRPRTTYRVRIAGSYGANEVRAAGGGPGRTPVGRVDSTLTFRTAADRAARLPLRVGRDATSALRLRRLAIPLPSFVTSVNQIGFDSYDLIAGTLAVEPPGADGVGRVLLWVTAGRRAADGTLRADPQGGFGFPLAGRYRGNALILSRRDLDLTFSFGRVPARRFELRGQLQPDGRMAPGASLYAEVVCRDVPVYGGALSVIGLCNDRGLLATAGTFRTDAYRGGAANRRPAGLRATRVRLARPTAGPAGRDGAVTAGLRLARGHRYRARDHVLGVVLVDARTGAPVVLDHVRGTRVRTDARGAPRSVRVRIPRGTALPARVRAYVVADAFGLGSALLRGAGTRGR